MNDILAEQIRKTADGLDVPKDYKLKFTPIAVIDNGKDAKGLSVAVAVEWQLQGNKRLPYVTAQVGRFHIQSGWLWEKNG